MGALSGHDAAVSMRARGLEPLVEYPGSNTPWPCICLTCGKEVSPRYSTVIGRGLGGCNFCAKKNSGIARNAKALKKYLAHAESSQIIPLSTALELTTKIDFQCKECGWVWSTTPNAVVNGRGCPRCAKATRVRTRHNRNEADARNLMNQAKLRPISPYPGMTKPWTCQCMRCGNLVTPTVSRVKVGQIGCNTCALVSRTSKRKLSNADALETMQAAEIQPEDPEGYVNSMTPWKGTCLKCGLSVSPTLNNLRSGHLGCRRCAAISADSSFDFFGKSVFYLVSNKQLDAGKIGIAGANTSRIAAHTSHGWEVEYQKEFEHGYDAWYLEGTVLEWLRGDLGVGSAVTDKDMPQGGYTETFSLTSITPERVWNQSNLIWNNHAWTAPQTVESPKLKPRLSCGYARGNLACTEKSYSKGFCRKHYTAFRKYGDPGYEARVRNVNQFCNVLEDSVVCGKPATRKGMCTTHYNRDYVHGSPTTMLRNSPQPLPPNCSVFDCMDQPYSLGFCKRHYYADRRLKKKQGQESN